MKAVRGLVKALNEDKRFKYKNPECVFDHVVIGAGVIGLAIAQRLCQLFPTKSTCLIERNRRVGEEISSRNSEVIHSGLYYPPNSLKTTLCLRGRNMMYERCRAFDIPFKQTGKLVVARKDQWAYIKNLHQNAMSINLSQHLLQHPSDHPILPTRLLDGDEARQMEPDLSLDIDGALWCPETGIVDSHSFMESLENDISESEGGEVILSTKVVRIDRYQASAQVVIDLPSSTREKGWVVQTSAAEEQATFSILARNLINASGLASTIVLNSILPEDKRIPMYFARGSYASYHGPGISQVSHLVYPCPEVGSQAHAFESLGTHLTLDLQGKIRFGPDIEWISPPNVAEPGVEDFWTKMMIPDESRMVSMHEAITKYLPNVNLERLKPDYVGIRPKLIPPKGGFQDFVIRTDFPDPMSHSKGVGQMVSLLGIESPGLTSSLAIAEAVVGKLYGMQKMLNGERVV